MLAHCPRDLNARLQTPSWPGPRSGIVENILADLPPVHNPVTPVLWRRPVRFVSGLMCSNLQDGPGLSEATTPGKLRNGGLCVFFRLGLVSVLLPSGILI